MPPVLNYLDEILMLAVVIVVPVAQRVLAYLAEKRREAEAHARARRREEAGLPADAPLDEGPEAGAGDDAEERGRDLWRELLDGLDGGVEPEPEPEPPTAPSKPRPEPSQAPVEVVATRAEPAEPRVAGDLAGFESVDLAGLEGALEAGARVPSEPLSGALSDFDSHRASEPLAQLAPVGSESAESDSAPAARVSPGGFGASAASWRRAFVLSELLAPPVALREPDVHAPPGLR
ncbi:MAG: hypothetical protein AAF682_25955 [Planctomycetota bacterium]